MNADITDITNVTGGWNSHPSRWGFICLPAVVPPVLALMLRSQRAPWVWMWGIAVALFIGAKWLTVSRFLLSPEKINPRRLLAYCFLWPGMDIGAFCAERPVAAPCFTEWVCALCKSALGAVLTWSSLKLTGTLPPLLVGWIAMIGLVLLLHFGLFDLLSLCWRIRGVKALPIMQSPISATSLARFWGGKWNAGFHDLVRGYFLPGLARRFGARASLFAIFLISGVVHELVISIPASGGYGGPTFYFMIQGLGVLLERGPVGKSLGFGSGVKGWCFVALMTVTPVGLLFHPPFIRNIILPMLQSIRFLL